MKDKTRIIYMGTTSFSAYILEGLINKGYNIVGVVTQIDKVSGRKKKINISEVKALALSKEIDIFQPESIKKDYAFIKEKNPDLIITCAYGQIVPKEVLDIPKITSINVHASLLPKYRGAAPIEYALLNDEKETGISIMEMVSKMDAGDVYLSKSIKIDNKDTRDTLFEKLKVVALNLLLETLPLIIKGNIKKKKQDEAKVSFAPSIKREEEHLDFNNKTRDLYNKIRAFNSIPGAYVLLDGEAFKIYESEEIYKDYIGVNGEIVEASKDKLIVKTSDGALSLLLVQPFSKKVMKIKDYLNGKKDLKGKILK